MILSNRDSYISNLHQKSGHSASLWKDYYLDHKYRLDEYINLCVNPSKPPIKTAKKPSPASFKVESSPRLPFPAPVSSGQQKQLPKLPQPAKLPQPSGSRRSTINSLTTHTPVYDDHLPPPNSEVKVPDPPSRSPSPPTKIISHNGRGNKYTPEDRVFFLKFIAWRLQGDPTLTRNELCLQLAAKVSVISIIHYQVHLPNSFKHTGTSPHRPVLGIVLVKPP